MIGDIYEQQQMQISSTCLNSTNEVKCEMAPGNAQTKSFLFCNRVLLNVKKCLGFDD